MMVGLLNIAPLSTAVLLAAILTASNGQVDVTTLTHGESNCQCSVFVAFCPGSECIGIRCINIDNADKVQCAQEFLANVTSTRPNIPLSCIILRSDVELFPDVFFLPYRVLHLAIFNSSMTAIPHSLIAPICNNLVELFIVGKLGQKSIIDEEFSYCTGLQILSLSQNVIEDVSPTAFSGLSKLQSLFLAGNQLTSFAGYEGLRDLHLLNLANNRLDHVDRNAFQSLSTLMTINLRDNYLTTLEEGTFDPLTTWPMAVDLTRNPLNCNCTLKWLQKWTINNNVDKTATCDVPEKVPVVDADFSLCTSSAYTNRKFLIEVLATSSMFIFTLMFISSV